jgi:hypothetical protein
MPTIKLSKTQAEEKGRHFVDLIERDVAARRTNIRQHHLLRNLYYDLGVRRLEYDGQCDIHLPVIMEKVEGIVPKVMNAFWQSDPHVHTQRVSTEADPKTTKLVERYLNWAIDTDIPNFYSTFESWVRNSCIDGVSVLKPWYNRKYRTTVIRKNIDPVWHAGGVDFTGTMVPEDRPKILEDILEETLGTAQISIVEADEATGRYVVDFVDNGVPYDGVEILIGGTERVDEIEVSVYRPVLVRENVEVDLLEFEDLIVPYRTNDLQEVERVTQQYWLTLPELDELRSDDGWDISDSEFDDLRARIEGKETEETLLENRELAEQKDQLAGEEPEQVDHTNKKDPAEAPKAFLGNKLLMFEVYTKDDLDGDGRAEEIIYQIPYGLRKIVSAKYLDDVYPHGRRPFVDLHYLKISDRFYSIGVAEQLAAIQIQADTIINDVNESQELINHPFGFYEPAASTADPKLLEDIPKGKLIPTANARGIVFPTFPQQPLANLGPGLDSVLMFADKLTLSPMSAGSTQSRNAPRTARGTLALLSEGAIKTDMFITAAQKGPWRELVHQIHELYTAFGPEHKFFQVVGHPYTEKISSEELRGRYVYGFTGNTVNTNREVKRTLEQVLYNTLMQNPLVMQDPNALQAITERFIKAFAEGTDTDIITPKPFGSGGTHPPMSQEAENQVMLQGGWVDVLPTDDHAAHMRGIDQLRRASEFEDADTWKISMVAAHYNQHAQALMQQMQQGATQSGPGQGNNVPTGMTLAQTDINALEGGNV